MNSILVKDVNLGGLSDSTLQGQASSVSEIVGLDIHSEPGFIKVNQKLVKESGSTVDDLVKAIVPCSDGNTYLFGSTNGKIWKRDSSGVYSLAATASPAAGAVGILDAREYQGYIYYAMQSRLGRVAVGAPTDWTGRSDSFATFTKTDASFHPMREQNQVLYIGDASLVAQVDAGVFAANALDLALPNRIKCLGIIATDLLVGAFINTLRAVTNIFRWNTWSVSFSISDEVPELGINAFLATDNFVLVNAGTKGNLYSYNGADLEQFKRIPGDWSGTNEASVNPNAACNMFGSPLFGLSNVSGNPAKQGVYSFNNYDRNYPRVLSLEWLISTGNSSGVEIGAISMVGTQMLVSWKDTTGGTTYGIDKIDTSNKIATAYFATREINLARNQNKALTGYVGYRSLPAGCTIKVYHKVNYAAAWTEATTEVDALHNLVRVKNKFPDASTIRLKVELNSSGNTAPEMDVAEFMFS